MEMSTMNLPGGKGRSVRKADNLTVICEPTVYKMWEPRCLTTLWVSTACYRDSFTFIFLYYTYTNIFCNHQFCEAQIHVGELRPSVLKNVFKAMFSGRRYLK
jgi:hypothetical protein